MSISHNTLANAIRFLSMDTVQKANSGHPGAPMGMADMAEVLWNNFLNHNPNNPHWANRDRFVLSNGHASAMLYSVLHLTGYDLAIDDLKNFRQLHSKTAGHPELGFAGGIETTTGPLGQGLANAVGFALAETMLAAQFNQEKHKIVDHYTYTFLGDGCMMEGISHEVASLAGVWGLNKLIALYDDNNISIDGPVANWFGDDTATRFEAYGWQVIRNVDGHNADDINQAFKTAKASADRPTLIMCKTLIGKGSPNKEGSESTHGSPLGADEIAATRTALKWNYGAFEIPEDIYAAWNAKSAGAAKEDAWNTKFNAYAAAFPVLAAEFKRRMSGDLPADFANIVKNAISACNTKAQTTATRVASQQALDALACHLPEIVGGSADLTPSNNTFFSASKDFDCVTGTGNYVRYGVREFGMSAILNGLALHGGLIPYAGTFLVFSDYARNAIRMSAIMKKRVIYVMTHDSIGLGEDGPTHQPVEHIQSLRLIPNLNVWRPCDAVETMVAWGSSLQSESTPSLLALSRQNLDHQQRNEQQLADISKGGYVLVEAKSEAKFTLIATGSEIALAVAAAKILGDGIRVVSMPCVDLFKAQDKAYQQSVLGNTKALAIEAGVSSGWYEFADAVIGLDRFGESAPAPELFKLFGFTVDNVVAKVKDML
ncbi:transketolase [Gammaproteobacteria bacterium]|nr:transketolase [Gammaproteobacteria bacterium]